MASPSSPQTSGPNWFSTRWKDLLRILLALLLIGLVFSKTDLQQIKSLGGSLVWGWLAATFLFYCVMTALKAVQYRALLGQEVPYTQVLRIVVIQNALTNLVASTAGIASYLTLFHVEQNVKVSRSGIVFILTKAGDLFAMCLFLLLSSLFVWERAAVLHEVVLVLLVTIFLAIGMFWTAIFLRQRFVSPVERLLHWLRLNRFGPVQRGIELLRSLAGLEHGTVMRVLLTGLALSLAYMTVTMAYSYSRIQAFQVPIDFWAILFIAALTQLVSLIPIQAFGGLGVIEFTSVYLYEVFGIPQVEMSAVLIGLRLVYYLFNLAVLLYLPAEALLRRRALNPTKP